MEISRSDEGQITWTFSGDSVRTGVAVCTLGFTGGPINDAVTVAPALYDAWSDNVLGNQSSSLGLRSVEVRTAAAVTTFTGSDVGGVSGEGEPPQVAIVVTKRTGQPGQSNRGRFYIPGLPEDSIDTSGTVQSLANWQSAVNGLLTDVNDALAGVDLEAALLHTDKNRTPTPIIAFVARGVCATQRGRVR